MLVDDDDDDDMMMMMPKLHVLQCTYKSPGDLNKMQILIGRSEGNFAFLRSS